MTWILADNFRMSLLPFHPTCRIFAAFSDSIQYLRIFAYDITLKDWFVMRDTISEFAYLIELKIQIPTIISKGHILFDIWKSRVKMRFP
ncbi:hypothetical protein NBZ79_15495 [Sneathiella marina]|uniref:Uncharacterized protein n=1 Tax=Sneathiella marina TaxID=2950108 RepID=A0ABY4W0B5_9PROT|nr:hypothetical protein [Sneathiella marina]USG60570.1 hypothetical protein NBZ79_15495 [Sneathiella marina]